MPLEDAKVGMVLVAGFATFLTGAAFWKPAVYQQALPQALVAMAADARRLRWIQSWMMAGVVTSTLGVILLGRWLELRGEHFWSTLAATSYTLGAPLMLASLAFGLTVRLWAADHAAARAEVPAGYEALDRWAGLLMAAHMVTAYTSWAFFGVALARSGVGPSWLGWSGIVAGAVLAPGFVVLRGGPFAPPILAHVYTAVVGIVLMLR